MKYLLIILLFVFVSCSKTVEQPLPPVDEFDFDVSGAYRDSPNKGSFDEFTWSPIYGYHIPNGNTITNFDLKGVYDETYHPDKD
jgi:hypothetical protein